MHRAVTSAPAARPGQRLAAKLEGYPCARINERLLARWLSGRHRKFVGG
jgi:hypothetical protein